MGKYKFRNYYLIVWLSFFSPLSVAQFLPLKKNTYSKALTVLPETAIIPYIADEIALKRAFTVQTSSDIQSSLTVLAEVGTLSTGLIATLVVQFVGEAQGYDVQTYDTETAVVDNFVYTYVSELEKQLSALLGETEQVSTVVEWVSPVVFISVGSGLKPDDLQHLTLRDMVGIWSSRVGIKRTGLLATKQVKMLTQKELDAEYGMSLLFCVPVMVAVRFDAGTYVFLIADMGCSHGASQFQEAWLKELNNLGFSKRDAEMMCSRETMLLVLGIIAMGGSEVMKPRSMYSIFSGHLLKVSVDCLMTGLKTELLPEDRTLAATCEIMIEGTLFTISVILLRKSGNVFIEMFRGKLRDSALYYAGTRVTRYGVAMVSLLVMGTINVLFH